MKQFFVIILSMHGVVSSQMLDETAKAVKLGESLPEDYNWTAYIKEGESTTGEMMSAYSGC